MIKIQFHNQWKYLDQNFRGITIIGLTFFDCWFEFSVARLELLGFSIDILLSKNRGKTK